MCMEIVMQQDVIVIGAGVLGVSVAYHLGQRGKRVLVLEKEMMPAVHSSGKNAGMIRQLYRNPQLTEWTYRSIRSWPQDIKEVCFRETGSIVVGRTPPAHHPDIFELRQLTTRYQGKEKQTPCVYTPTDGLLDSGGYVQQLMQAVDRTHVSFQFRTRVVDVRQDDQRWCVTTDDGTKHHASWVINAGGAWLNEYLNADPLMQVEASPYARHLFVTSGWREDFMPSSDCGFYWEEEAGWYMRLWDPETRLVSVCERIPASDPDVFEPHPEIAEEIAVKLLDSLPDVADSLGLSRSWHCFRTYTDDQSPIWGEDPDFPGLFWLAAFGGFGMSTSFAATEDAARAICGEQVDVPSAFSPTRVRTPKEEK
ncbi:MAG TPA: hypothetical protein DCE42_21870 [Myxococcales bacterium]|nr:hypothetical protein [Deltaproteobacteria bacterium]MBU52585.1 hypothetical protein [Deltaproteobacteria bacterium]HAA57428.1 hypothetical protein [Myxococcales bacterium]